MVDKGKMMRFRVLRDFDEHKQGDIVEMAFLDAQPLVNSDRLTADLGESETSDMEEVRTSEGKKGRGKDKD